MVTVEMHYSVNVCCLWIFPFYCNVLFKQLVLSKMIHTGEKKNRHTNDGLVA